MTLFQSLTLPGKGSGLKIEGVLKTGEFGGQITLGSIVSKLLSRYVFFFAGLCLLFMLIAGGFQLLTSAGDPETVKAGQSKIVSALIGFFIIFVAYWLMQIIEIVLGFKILG